MHLRLITVALPTFLCLVLLSACPFLMPESTWDDDDASGSYLMTCDASAILDQCVEYEFISEGDRDDFMAGCAYSPTTSRDCPGGAVHICYHTASGRESWTYSYAGDWSSRDSDCLATGGSTQ